MLARTSERKMLFVRASLFLGWGVLIGSLFYDPITQHWTEPDNLLSPLHIGGAPTMVQGVDRLDSPYHAGNRVFWTMIVPLLPLFLMVFGHEAWRRICPLSFASQIPRYLGLVRKHKVVQRRTGRIEPTLALIGRGDWIARHAWYIQFGLLFCGLCGRLLITNNSRLALGLAMLAVIGAAIVVGLLWGGKSWCNYFCPANVVQKIYTEPRGLLESAPHLSRLGVSQAMCRSTTSSGEVSACVACTASCGDIDLERSYWDTIMDPARRRIYYMFFGLIVGFYGYYYLYAGNWSYYFSGFWTREPWSITSVLAPGLYIFGQTLPIPKFVAVPMVLGIAVLAGLALGTLGERLYRALRRRAGDIPEAEIVNHCLSFSAYLSINTFYLFGGRPNLLLLPPAIMHGIDILIVGLTTLWLWQALQRSPFKYRQEGMASSLLEQLKKLKVDVSRYLDGRSLEQLKPSEIYMLTKVLPAFSHQQKITAYRNILDDAISMGTTSQAVSRNLLREVQQQMGITDEEHHLLLEQLGIADPVAADTGASTAEKAASLVSYRQMLGDLIGSHVELGRSLSDLLGDPSIAGTITVLRGSLQISDANHLQTIHELLSADGLLGERMTGEIDHLQDLLGARFCLETASCDEPFSSTINTILLRTIDRRLAELYIKLLSILRAFGDEPLAFYYARSIAVLSGEAIRPFLAKEAPEGLRRWEETFEPGIVEILLGKVMSRSDAPVSTMGLRERSFRDVIHSGLDLPANLQLLLEDKDPIICALALAAFAYLDADVAVDAAAAIEGKVNGERQWLLRDVVATCLGRPNRQEGAVDNQDWLVTVMEAGKAPRAMRSQKPCITIGRAPGNDVQVNDPAIRPYHVAIRREREQVFVMPLDMAAVDVNGRACEAEAVLARPGTVIGFGPAAAKVNVRLDWDDLPVRYKIDQYDVVTRLAYLACNARLYALPLEKLVELAHQTRVCRYPRLSGLSDATQPRDEFYYLHLGALRLTAKRSSERPIVKEFQQGQVIDGLMAREGAGFDDWVLEVETEFAIVLVLPAASELIALFRIDDLPPLPASIQLSQPDPIFEEKT